MELPDNFIFDRLQDMVKTKKKADEIEEKEAVLIEGKPIVSAQNAVSRDFSGVFKKDIEEMFMAGVHFGYSRSSRYPKMQPYLFALRNNVEIFDLEKTYACLEKAKKFLEDLAKEGKKILIVSTKPGMHQLVEEAGRELNIHYVSERWLGGTMNKFKMIKGRIDHLIGLRQKKTAGELNKYTKKEISRFNKEIARLERFLGGLETLTNMPAAVLIIDPKKEKTAFRESKQMLIPIIAVVNSDSNPDGIAYPIPANDSSPASVKYLLNFLVKAYKNGLTKPVAGEKLL